MVLSISRAVLILIVLALHAFVVVAQASLKDGEYKTDINGIQTWYKVAGANHHTTPLVIIHGGPGGNVYNFERIVGPLIEKFSTVVYYEQRGSGRSAAPASKDDYSISILISDLDVLRQKLGLQRIIPLGFSFGGELALEYALAHPENVERLILQSPSTGDWDRQHLVQVHGFESVAPPEIAARIGEIMRGSEPLEDRWNKVWSVVDTPTVDRLLFHNPEAARRNRELWDKSGLRNTGDMYRALVKHQSQVPLLQRARRLTIPTLILIGIYDRNVGVDPVRDLARVLSDHRLVIFENSAHFPDIEEPSKYAATVRVFLRGASKH